MKRIALAATAILALAGAIGPAWSGEGGDNESAAGPAWLATVADQKLIAVDGSTLTLSPGHDALALTTVSQAGGAQKKLFVLMSDNMGTVADAANSASISGFFRVTDSGLDAQFSDGHSETLMLNGAGGITLATRGSTGGPTCVSWYPSGHLFSDAERRAALADYANRLGLAQSAKAPRPDSCAAQKAVVQAPPAAHATRHALHSADASPSPLFVHASVSHPVDDDAALPPPAAPAPVAWVKTAVVQKSEQPPAADAPAGSGASNCLSVESDGVNLGFRNQCGYGVQFVYCLQMESEQAASCDAGGKPGAVSANAFTPLLLGANIKQSDAEHDFRWVACSGGAGEVTPHLDRADPPAGRCVRIKSS
jgi:hypothetical protein